MGTTRVPPLASLGLTTTELDVGGVSPPGGVEWFNHHKWGFGVELCLAFLRFTFLQLNSLTATTGGLSVLTTTGGGSGGRGYPPGRSEILNHQPNVMGVVPFRFWGGLTTTKSGGG